MKAQCLLVTSKKKAELSDFDLPNLKDGQILVRTVLTLVSPGTELRCWEGGEPGSDSHPFIPGYTGVGIVEKSGKGCTLKPGTRVYRAGTQEASLRRLWGGHVSHAILSEDAAQVIPTNVSFREAAMAGLCAIAFRGFQLAKPLAGESAVVIGLGAIGQGSARLLTMCGVRTICLDLAEHRVQFSRKAGLDAHVVKGTLKQTLDAILPGGVDIIVDATGSPRVIEQAVELGRDLPWDNSLKPGCRYVVQGSPDAIPFPYNPTFQREMTILVPRAFVGPNIMSVLGLMSLGKITLADCVTEMRKPQEIQQTYEQLSDRNAPAVTMAFEWSKE